MSRKILPLRGVASLRALNAFHALLLGLKMLPMYVAVDYTEFYESFRDMSDERKEAKLRQALVFVNLSAEEVGALISFATDPNGVPYRAENKDNLTPEEIFEICVAVCMEIGRIKIDLVSEAEQKKNRERNDRPEADVHQAPGGQPG